MYRFYSKVNSKSNVRVAVVGDYQDGELRVSVARCSSKDKFIRSKGRMIAEGRFSKGKFYSKFPVGNVQTNLGEIFVGCAKKVIDEIVDNPQLIS